MKHMAHWKEFKAQPQCVDLAPWAAPAQTTPPVATGWLLLTLDGSLLCCGSAAGSSSLSRAGSASLANASPWLLQPSKVARCLEELAWLSWQHGENLGTTCRTPFEPMPEGWWILQLEGRGVH